MRAQPAGAQPEAHTGMLVGMLGQLQLRNAPGAVWEDCSGLDANTDHA